MTFRHIPTGLLVTGIRPSEESILVRFPKGAEISILRTHLEHVQRLPC